MSEDLEAWLSDSTRKAGDATAISPEGDEYSYVFYYLSESDPWWMVSVKNTLLSTAMETYIEEITADIPVEDPKGNLKYLYVSEEGSDAADNSEPPDGSDAADSSSEAGSSSAQ